MSKTNNKSEKKDIKVIHVEVSLDQYDDIHRLKANSGKIRIGNKDFYHEIFMAGVNALSL